MANHKGCPVRARMYGQDFRVQWESGVVGNRSSRFERRRGAQHRSILRTAGLRTAGSVACLEKDCRSIDSGSSRRWQIDRATAITPGQTCRTAGRPEDGGESIHKCSIVPRVWRDCWTGGLSMSVGPSHGDLTGLIPGNQGIRAAILGPPEGELG